MEKLWQEGGVWASDHINLNVKYGGYVSEYTLEKYADGDGSGPRNSGETILDAWHNYCVDNNLYGAYEAHHWMGNFYNWKVNYGDSSGDKVVGQAYTGRIIPYEEMDIGDCTTGKTVFDQGEYGDGYRASGVTSTNYADTGDRMDDNSVFATLIHEFAHNAIHPGHNHHNLYDYEGYSWDPSNPTCMAYNDDDCTAGESNYSSPVDDNAYVWGNTYGYAISSWLMYGEANGNADSVCQVEERCHPGLENDSYEDLPFIELPEEASEKAKDEMS